MSGRQAKIVVIGSYAVGMTMGCARFPGEGETVMGRGFQLLHGGKGSNQAIAVARLGGAATFGGAVGKDSFGDSAVAMLREEGIDTTFVKRMDGIATGVGFVIVADSGNNEIVIDLAANNHLLPADIEGMRSAIASADLLLVQLEVNAEAVIRAIEVAHQEETPVILNPAPYQKLPDEAVKKTTYITPNETEAAAMLGLSLTGHHEGKMLAEKLFERYRVNVLVTLGENGVYVRTDAISEQVPVTRPGLWIPREPETRSAEHLLLRWERVHPSGTRSGLQTELAAWQWKWRAWFRPFPAGRPSRPAERERESTVKKGRVP